MRYFDPLLGGNELNDFGFGFYGGWGIGGATFGGPAYIPPLLGEAPTVSEPEVQPIIPQDLDGVESFTLHMPMCACCGGDHDIPAQDLRVNPAYAHLYFDSMSGELISSAEAPDPVSSVQGTSALLGQDQQSIKVFFTNAGALSNVGNLIDPSSQAEWTGEEDWTQAEINIILAALDEIEEMIDVNFVVTTNAADAEIDFFKNDDSGSLGTALTSTNSGGGNTWAESSVRINHTISGRWEFGKEKGGQGYETLVHEIGHALGLGHTHDTGLGSQILQGMTGQSAFSGGLLGINDPINSIMAYRDGWAEFGTSVQSHGNRANFGAWDIGALINRYGANNTTATGDDTYQLPIANGQGTFFQTIWDNSGTDTISAMGASDRAIIDLRAATLDYTVETTGGPVSYVEDSANGFIIRGGFTIAGGVVIENAIGSSFNDTIVGNSASNTLEGRLGADTLTGGAGADEFYFNVFSGIGEVDGDVITDFEAGDFLSFDGLGTYNFDFRGDTGFSGAAAAGIVEIYFVDDGNNVSLFFDFNGDAINDATVSLNGSGFGVVEVANSTEFLQLAFDQFGGKNPVIGTNNPELLQGTAADDFIQALDGADTLFGDLGADTLEGGGGIDTFDFVLDAALFDLDGDLIIDLEIGEALTFDFSTLSGFAYIGDAMSFTGAGPELRYEAISGFGYTDILFDADGDTFTDATLRISNGEFDFLDVSSSATELTLEVASPAVPFADTLGADNLTGTGGDETITILADGADDAFNAVGGTDTLDYSGLLSGGVSVFLDAATSTGAGTGNDVVLDFENVIGTSDADTIRGNDEANTLNVNGGFASFIIGTGASVSTLDDIAIGNRVFDGEGADTVTNNGGSMYLLLDTDGVAEASLLGGGAFTDTLDLALANSAVTVDLSLQGTGGSNVISGGGLGDQDGSTISGFSAVGGSDFDDTLTAFTHVFDGDGADAITILNSFGYVTLAADGVAETSINAGGGGQLSLVMATSAVTVDLSAQVSALAETSATANFTATFDGDTVVDVSAASFAAGTVRAADSAPFVASDAGDPFLTGGGLGDQDGGTVTGFDAVFGSNFDDTLTGDANGNVLNGYFGNDIIDGGAGDDTIIGAQGSDTLTGGAGADTFLTSVSEMTDAVDTITDIEGTDFISLGGITLIGNASFTGAANEVRYFFDGNDTIVEVDSNGDQTADGYFVLAGGDFALEETSPGLLQLSAGPLLLDGTPDDDVLEGGAFDDTINGLGGNDIIRGFGGNDVLDGGEGNDTVEGGDGDDTILGTAGSDTLDGGAGDDEFIITDGSHDIDGGDDFDLVKFEQGLTPLPEPLLSTARDIEITDTGVSDTFGQMDATLANIEQVRIDFFGTGQEIDDQIDASGFSGSGGVFYADDGGANSFIGSSGDDRLFALGGTMDATGGDGVDTANIYIDASSGATSMTITEDLSADGYSTLIVDQNSGLSSTFSGFESYVFLAPFPETSTSVTLDAAGVVSDVSLVGFDGNDVLIGGFGEDILSGNGGADTMTGGAGEDFFDVGFALESDGDVITDFDNADIIRLRDGQFFSGTSAFSSISGEVRYEFRDGNTIIQVDADGDAQADAEIALLGIEQDLFVTSLDFEGMDLQLAGEFSGVPTEGDDVLQGGDSNDIIDGLGGDDFIGGGDGDDELRGGAGDDVIAGDTGFDTVFGGAGSDSIIVDDSDTVDGGDDDDVIFGAQSTSGFTAIGGYGSDLIEGSEFNDFLYGGPVLIDSPFGLLISENFDDDQVDQLFGGGGNDNITAGAGDIVDGGDGFDTLSVTLAALSSGVNLDLRNILVADKIDLISSTLGASIVNMEALSTLFGTDFDDVIMTDRSPLNIRGGGGDDFIASSSQVALLVGDDGNDTLDASQTTFFALLGGGAGDDTILGGSGDDSIQVAAAFSILDAVAGNDTVDGGDGFDTLDYLNQGIFADLTIDLAIMGFQDTGFGLLDVVNVEAVRGGEGDDALYGDGADNQLDGGVGADSLFGRDGDDTLISAAFDFAEDILEGGAGADTLIGDGLFDFASYSGSSAGVEVDLNLGIVRFGDAEGDTLSGIMGLIGSDFADVLRGDSGDNVLRGGAGSDLLEGGDGNDTIWLDLSDVRLDGSNQAIDLGGAGYDTLVMEAGNRFTTGVLNLYGFEAFQGADGDDIVRGNDFTINYDLRGGAGNDTLTGRDGNDYLEGGEGVDTLLAGAGDDTVVMDEDDVRLDSSNRAINIGGDGFDMLVWDSDLGFSTGGLSFYGFEAFTGGRGNDNVRGNDGSVAYTLFGEEGDDRLTGNASGDVLRGGLGDDTLVGGAGGDTFFFSAIDIGSDTVSDFEAGTDTIFLEGFGYFSALDAGLDLTQVGNDVQFQRGLVSFTVIGATVADVAAAILVDGVGPITDQADGLGAGMASAFAEFGLDTASAQADLQIEAPIVTMADLADLWRAGGSSEAIAELYARMQSQLSATVESLVSVADSPDQLLEDTASITVSAPMPALDMVKVDFVDAASGAQDAATPMRVSEEVEAPFAQADGFADLFAPRLSIETTFSALPYNGDGAFVGFTYNLIDMLDADSFDFAQIQEPDAGSATQDYIDLVGIADWVPQDAPGIDSVMGVPELWDADVFWMDVNEFDKPDWFDFG